MRIVIVGLGTQGINRRLSAKGECIATIDPDNPIADYKSLQELAINSYDAVFICTPDEQKYALVRYALVNKKHVLVEKPLMVTQLQQLEELDHLAKVHKLVCYTASNCKFEPYIVRLKNLLDSKVLGKIYNCRLFYGDSTATSVLVDLGTHMLDVLHYLFGSKMETSNFTIISKKNFDNDTPDHVIFGDFSAGLNVEVELTALAWRHHFSCDIIAENGSVHLSSLCKWGSSSFLLVQRALPGENVLEENETLVQSDPTFDLEHEHFKQLCLKDNPLSDLTIDQWIHSEIGRLAREEILIA